MDVDLMLSKLTPLKFYELMAYHSLEPLGESRADIHAAQIAQMIHNMGVKKGHAKKLDEFLLKFDLEEKGMRRQGPKEHRSLILGMARSYATAEQRAQLDALFGPKRD